MGTPHSYTADTLEEALRDTVGDPSSNPSQRWTAANCADYLNRGMGWLALQIPTEYETSWTIDTWTANTRSFALPVDFVADKRVEWIQTANTDEQTLIFLDEAEWKANGFQERKSDTGTPRYYTYLRDLGAEGATALQPKHIVLYPIPDASKVLKIYGFKIPEVLTAGTSEIPELITPKLEAVIMYAAYLMMRDDQQDVRADRFYRDAERQVQLIRYFNAKPTESRPMMLKPWRHIGGVYPPYLRRIG